VPPSATETIKIKPGSSMERVVKAAEAGGLSIDLKVMEQSTRTAEEAASACSCDVAQIVKSLVFEDAKSGRLVLLLVSGAHNADADYLHDHAGLALKRCDGRRVRDETGFAIGGVAPIGHKTPIAIYMDKTLLTFPNVWAAAGRPDSVFRVDPKALAHMTKATIMAVRP
jgi:prolyl-tRNA editing enzyme YbaK/EbsC (Cys-tRNA(Pro) deacylase)